MHTMTLGPGRTWWCVTLAAALTWATTAEAAERPESPAGFLPQGALVYVELNGPAPVIERVAGSNAAKLIRSTDRFQEFLESGSYHKAQAARQVFERQVGLPLREAVAQLLGGRAALAAYPSSERKQPDPLLLVRGADPQAVTQLRDGIKPFLELGAGEDEETRKVAGVEILKSKGAAYAAMHADWIVASRTRQLVATTVEYLVKPDKRTPENTLAGDPAYREMTGRMGPDHLVRVFVNTQAIAEATGGRFGIPQKLDNPLASLLFGGILELAVRSPYAGLTVDAEEQRFVATAVLPARTKELDDAHRVFFSDPDSRGAGAVPPLDGLVGGITLYRDFAAWYKNREQLLQAKVLPAFDKFEAGLGNLLPGRDVSKDVLPLFGPRLTLLAARQDYSHLNGKPGVKLPGFAVIGDLAEPEQGADTLRLFYQTVSAVLNFQAGQQGRQPWVQTSETHNGVQISYSRYLEAPEGERLPIVYNFMPASARVGNRFVLATSRDVCRRIVDTLQQPERASHADNRNFQFALSAASLADILEANRELLQSRAVQSGKKLADAEAEFGKLLELVRLAESLSVSTRVRPEAFELQLEGAWK